MASAYNMRPNMEWRPLSLWNKFGGSSARFGRSVSHKRQPVGIVVLQNEGNDLTTKQQVEQPKPKLPMTVGL
jgi:hypothetical protein